MARSARRVEESNGGEGNLNQPLSATASSGDVEDLPLVSVIVPCRNEQQFIGPCLDSILQGSYPHDRIEVLVVDGMSEDNTRKIVEGFSSQYPFIKLLENPKRITPVGLNIGVRQASGEILVRMDAHTSYAPDYVFKSVKYLEEFKADNVGGHLETVPRDDGVIGRAIAIVLSHPFGVGNSRFRTGAEGPIWVDTVFGGCWRREVFERIGLFDERLAKGQDREFNHRLRQAGGRILMVPEIACQYVARSNLKEFLEWIFLCGSVPFYISKVARTNIFSMRNLIPPLFVLVSLGSLLLSIVSQVFLWLFLTIVVLYLVPSIYFSVQVARKERDIRFLATMPLAFLLTHLVYGIGSWVGILRRVPREVEPTK